MRKPKYLSSDVPSNYAISVKYHEIKHFPNPLHYHKELELAYIVEGYGTRYVGSSIKSFAKGDLVLIGQELNHVWMSHDDFYKSNNNLITKAIVIKFYPDFAGKDFIAIPEAYLIKKVLDEASGGLRIKGEASKAIRKVMKNMFQQNSLEQIVSLIQILNFISKGDKVSVLSNFDYHKSTNPKDKNRMNKIIQYTMLNFKTKIALSEIANIANLSKSAFCRYFKNTVKKSYNDFLYDLRVEFACKLLMESDNGITQICYESGFNNPSAFSQIFKRIKGVSPNQYRKANKIKKHT